MSDIDRSASTFRVRADASQADRELDKFQNSISGLTSQIERLNAGLARPVRVNTRQATRELSRFANTAKNSFGALAAFNTFTAATSGLLSGAFAFAVINATTNLVKLGAQAESTRERFLALSASISDGRRRYQEFADFADQRGLQFRGLVEAANQLRVVGFAGEELDSLIRQIGIVAGDSTERVERITRALGQMRAFGRVALEELNQLTEAGVPIITAIAQELDVPEGRVRGLIELGKIDFQTVRRAFADLASESSAFFAASEAQSETLQASFNRFSNASFMLADTINERVSPSFKFFVESGADVITFFSTAEGVITALSIAAIGVFIPAFGGLFLLMANFIGSTADPILLRFRAINVQLARSAVNAGIMRRAFLLLGASIRAAFTPALAVFTTIAVVAIPLLIARMERLRAEAERIQEVVDNVQPGTITEVGTPEDFVAVRNELERLQRIQNALSSRGEAYQKLWGRVTESIESATGNTTNLELTQTRYAFTLHNIAEDYAEIDERVRSLRIAIGELVPPPSLDPVVFPDEARNKLIADTDRLSEEIQSRIVERISDLEHLTEFVPAVREEELRKLIDFLEEQSRLVAELAAAGFLFLPEGSTLRFINGQLEIYNEELEQLRKNSRSVKTPLEEFLRIIQRNEETLRDIRSDATAGILLQSEVEGERLEANREALSSLLSLYDKLRLSSDPAAIDILPRLQSAIENFKLEIPDDLGSNVFEVITRNIEDTDTEAAFNAVFTDTERTFKAGLDRFLDRIANITDIGPLIEASDLISDEQAQDFQDMLSLFRSELNLSDAIFPEPGAITDRAKSASDELKEGIELFDADGLSLGTVDIEGIFPEPGAITNRVRSSSDELKEGVARFIPIVNNQIEQYADASQGIRDFGRLLGIELTEQNTILVDLLKERGDITEEEAFRLHDVLALQSEEIENISSNNERLDRALSRGFRIDVPSELRAITNFVITLGEAFVSIQPAATNFFDLLESIGEDLAGDVAGSTRRIFRTVATLISVGRAACACCR